MDARVQEESQSHRTSIKRPWEDSSLAEEDNINYPAFPPALEIAQYRKSSMPQDNEPRANSEIRHGPDSHEPLVVKKYKFDGYQYRSAPKHVSDNGDIAPVSPSYPGYSHQRGFTQSPIFSTTQREAAANGPAESQDTSNLCGRCGGLTTQIGALDVYGAPDSYRFLIEVCTQMNQLAATLRSGISAEQHGIIRGAEQRDLGFADIPPIEQFGLNQTLKWILSRITQCNYMVDELVRQVPAGTSQLFEKASSKNRNDSQDGPSNIMKRRIDVDRDEIFRNSGQNVEFMSDTRAPTRRRSVATAPLMSEETTSMRPQLDYYPSQQSSEGHISRASVMNPPPAPTRQLPSPPGRSFPSPTSINFPSPSASQYGNPGVNLPPPSNLHQSVINNYLPPIAVAHSPDSALRDHSAALQHEVSVQKIALSSLQGEHDKLLAAFSRSQTRASALEKKHAVSDSEIISLTEEKLRLQTQVIELERDVDELSRSRDEFRQAAVQEGSQYVEIVKKASRLEEMAGEERKAWNRLKEEMEQQIGALSNAANQTDIARHSAIVSTNPPAHPIFEQVDTVPPTSPIDLPADLKVESLSETLESLPTSHPNTTQQESATDLKEEIRKLRERCTEVENALRTIRDDNRSMEGVIKALLDRADSTLRD